MIKRVCGSVLLVCLLMGLCGCVALWVGATAGGVSSAVWLSGKLSQNVNASFDQTTVAARSAMESLNLEITKETRKKKIAQIIGKYTDGKTIWIDVHAVSPSHSKVEVRVGAVHGDKEAAYKILQRINNYL